MLLSSAFVGAFAGFIFPPIIMYGLKHFEITVDESSLGTPISGLIGAVSWQLITTVKMIVPKLINKLLTKFGIGANKDERKENK
jgi:hypothetical protein